MSLITGITDSLVNFITGLGTAKDPRSSSRFYFRELNRNVLEQMYRSDWLARRLVDLPAEDATREWRQWQASGKALEKIGQVEKKFEVQKKMRQGLSKGRLYGGSALVLGVDVGQPEDELDLDDVGLDDLKFVVVLNRYELSAGPRIYNVDSPYYTRPEYYTISTPMFGFLGETGGSTPGRPLLSTPGRRVQSDYGMVRVHPSRVIEFVGNELPDWRLAPMGGGWGDSVLQTIDDSLRDFAMITGGLASMINDMKMDVVRVPDLSRKLSNADTSGKLIERFTVANSAKSTINTLLLDKEEEWERISTTFGSTPELIAKAMTIACAAGGVPESRVMGSAPGKGLSGAGSSGGEVDIHNYYDDVKSKQKTQYTPTMMPLDRCIQQSATGRYDASIDYEWNPLYQPTPSELSTIALAKAQTTQIYVGLSLINENAMREATISQLTEDNVYPGLEDAIDEFGAEPEEPVEPTPPTPPPGMLPKGHFEPNPFAMLKAQASGALPKPGAPGQPAGGRPAIGARKGVSDYSPDEPRDDHGRWGSGGGGLTPSTGPDGPVLFHGTTAAAVEAIKQYGLSPVANSGAGATSVSERGLTRIGPRTAAVYFAASPHAAERFAKEAASVQNSTPVVFPVHLSADEASKLVWDQAGNEDSKLEAAIPPGMIGRAAVGLDAIHKLTSTWQAKWQQHELGSYQKTGGQASPQYTFKSEDASAVHDIMDAGDRAVLFATIFVGAPVTDFNPDHDGKTGRFIGKSTKKAHEAGLNAVAGVTGIGGWGDPAAAKRSATASAAHAKRKANAAQPFSVPAGATPNQTGLTAVARVIAKEKGRGRTATKGEVSAAAKEDVKTAVETWASTKGLQLPEGVDSDKVKTAYRMGVMMKQFITDPETRKTMFSQISRNSVSWSQKAMSDLPAHALTVAHHGIAGMIADKLDEFVTDAVVGGIVTAATALGGPVGGLIGTAASVGLKSEIKLGVDKMTEAIGLTPEHIAAALHGLGHTMVSTYQRWKKAAGHAITSELGAFSAAPHKGQVAHAHDGEPLDPIEESLQLIAEVLDEREHEVLMNSGDNF